MEGELAASRRARHRVSAKARPRLTGPRAFGAVLLAALVAGCIVVVAAVTSGDWQVQPILSGSMRPGFPVGGVVAVQRVPASSLQVRDVVLFHPPGHPNDTYVHRIISMTKSPSGYIIKTQGDANQYPDPWTIRFKGKWAYEARFTLPLIGYAAVWDHSPSGHQDLFLAGSSLLVVVAGGVIVGELRRIRRRKVAAGDKGAGSAADTGRSTDPGRRSTSAEPVQLELPALFMLEECPKEPVSG